jgi:hypothetical protein
LDFKVFKHSTSQGTPNPYFRLGFPALRVKRQYRIMRLDPMLLSPLTTIGGEWVKRWHGRRRLIAENRWAVFLDTLSRFLQRCANAAAAYAADGRRLCKSPTLCRISGR